MKTETNKPSINKNQDSGEEKYFKREAAYIKAWDEFYIEW